MKIFCHNDADGMAAGYIVLSHESYHSKSSEHIEVFPINYNDEFPFEKIRKDERVYIVDFSIPPDDMRKLIGITKNILWFDHHKSNIEKFKDFDGLDELTKVILDTSRSGCLITWEFLRPDNEVPLAIKLIDDHDRWIHGLDGSKALVMAMNGYDLHPLHSAELWADILLNPTEHIKIGNLILGRDTRYLEDWGWETEFEGYNCLAMNLARCGFDSFASRRGDFDIYISYVHDGKRFSVSLYSETVDVSKIAMKYGGGGHKGASGFTVDQLPFTS